MLQYIDELPAIQLTIEEYIVASLCNDKAFILHNDATREMVIIQSVQHGIGRWCDLCKSINKCNCEELC
jgi:hypothetical protein